MDKTTLKKIMPFVTDANIDKFLHTKAEKTWVT